MNRPNNLEYYSKRLGLVNAVSFFPEPDDDTDNSAVIKRLVKKIGFIVSHPDFLTIRQKECIRLFYYENKSYNEICETLGICKSVVCRHIKRGLARIKDILRLVYYQD